MPPFPSAQPFCEDNFSHLIGSARVRYKETIELCENVDPYTLRLGTDTSADSSLLPSIAHGDIVNYLVFSTSFVTLDQMKAYKALESHDYFTSVWVKSLSAKRLGEDKVLLLVEVNHSQRLGERPLKVWVLCKQSGAVVTVPAWQGLGRHAHTFVPACSLLKQVPGSTSRQLVLRRRMPGCRLMLRR
ncbi:hypothetical protein HPB52_023540 [Rhipicephalus sanguineus]|uniref:Uncharacterized protein n=1 Tax=Rhipicephalus sanguineus TaxID=34632 RepID=A0A9D4PH64_RHISA|nr:hypothetical protein HPB52_023540 [Rhipicephalus sanguineus]